MPQDYVAVEDLTEQAFGQTAEAEIVRRVRKESALHPISLVAVRDQMIVGHVLFSKISLSETQTSGPLFGTRARLRPPRTPAARHCQCADSRGACEVQIIEMPRLFCSWQPRLLSAFRFPKCIPGGLLVQQRRGQPRVSGHFLGQRGFASAAK